MFLPTLLVLGFAAVCLATEDIQAPNRLGTVLTVGRLDVPLQPVAGSFYIPEGQCSGHLHAKHYSCARLVSLQVTALSDVPPNIKFVNGLDSGVHVFGCGPVVITLAHACTLLDDSPQEDHFTPLPPLDSDIVPDSDLAYASDPVPAVRSAPDDVACPLCKLTKKPVPKRV